MDIKASGCHNTSAHASSGDAFLWRLPRMRIPAKIKAVAVAVCHLTFFVRMGRRLVWCLHHCCVVSLQLLHLAEVLHNTPQHPLCVKALQRRAAAHQVRPPTELMMRACKSCSAACISCRSAHCCAHAHPLRNHSMINTSLETMHTCTSSCGCHHVLIVHKQSTALLRTFATCVAMLLLAHRASGSTARQ